MKRSIRIFLNKHKKIDYIQRVIRYQNNKEFCNDVIQWREDPLQCSFEHLGENNPDIIVYIIEIDNPTSGFFAVYKLLLEYLYFCDYMHFIPTIKLPSSWLYSDNNSALHNPFYDFFDGNECINYNTVDSSRCVLRAKYHHRKLVNQIFNSGTFYRDNEEKLIALSKIAYKYLDFKQDIKDAALSDFYALIGSCVTLGVHVRGTDYKRAFDGHPVYVSIKDYMKIVDDYTSLYNIEKIFLATDDSNAEKAFKEKYGSKVVCFDDTNRSDGDISVSMLKLEEKRSRLGFEVIRDAVSLSNCAYFIGNLSMVSTAAQILKFSRDESYVAYNILNKGLNETNVDLSKFEKNIKDRG